MSPQMPRKVLRHIFVSFFTIFLSHTFVTPDCRAYPTGSSQQGTSGPGKEVLSAPAYVDSGNFEADIVEQFVLPFQRRLDGLLDAAAYTATF